MSRRVAAMGAGVGAGVLIGASLACAARAETTAPTVPTISGQTVSGQTVANPAPLTVPAAAPTALTVLLEQARYWQQQNRFDLAITSLQRAFEIDPRSADALALAAELHAQQGDRQAAEADLAKLRAIQPNDPRLVSLAQTVTIGPIDQNVLADARALAQQGRPAEAVERYRAVFHGDVPATRWRWNTIRCWPAPSVAGMRRGWGSRSWSGARPRTRAPSSPMPSC